MNEDNCAFCNQDSVTTIDVEDDDGWTHEVDICIVCVDALQERYDATVNAPLDSNGGDDGGGDD